MLQMMAADVFELKANHKQRRNGMDFDGCDLKGWQVAYNHPIGSIDHLCTKYMFPCFRVYVPPASQAHLQFSQKPFEKKTLQIFHHPSKMPKRPPQDWAPLLEGKYTPLNPTKTSPQFWL